jgi:hypothetical protein
VGSRIRSTFKLASLHLLCFDVAVPAGTGKQRNRIWSQNENRGRHPFLCRTLYFFERAKKTRPPITQFLRLLAWRSVDRLRRLPSSISSAMKQSNETLKGSKGTILLFFRSADW